MDFHALRHTRGVWLAQHVGATPAEIRELMRVGSLALVDRYTKSLRITANLAERGPDLTTPKDQQRATGTAGATFRLPSVLPSADTRQITPDNAKNEGATDYRQFEAAGSNSAGTPAIDDGCAMVDNAGSRFGSVAELADATDLKSVSG